MHHQPDNLLSHHKGNITTTLRGQKYGSFDSKLWHFWAVTHGVLAEPDNGLWLRRTTRQRDYETFASQDYKSTRQRVGRLPVGLRRNYGITDLWIYGFMDFGFAASDNGLWLRFATPDNKTTRQQVGRLPVGLRRNYGITDRAKWLETQSSVTLYTLLYSLYSQLTANCSHALALRCLLYVDCSPKKSLRRPQKNITL